MTERLEEDNLERQDFSVPVGLEDELLRKASAIGFTDAELRQIRSLYGGASKKDKT